MGRERVLYEETYHKGATVRKELLPERFPFMAAGAKVLSMEMRRAGRIEVDGEEREFCDVRILIQPPPEGPDV